MPDMTPLTMDFEDLLEAERSAMATVLKLEHAAEESEFKDSRDNRITSDGPDFFMSTRSKKIENRLSAARQKLRRIQSSIERLMFDSPEP